MANRPYIERLRSVILQLHGCNATHVKSVHVNEVFRGQTVWQGEVEVFDVDHPHAKRCYAWNHAEGQLGQGERFVAILEIPPINSPETAVRASIVAEVRKSKGAAPRTPVEQAQKDSSDRRDEAIQEVRDMRARVARERGELRELMDRFRKEMGPTSNGPGPDGAPDDGK